MKPRRHRRRGAGKPSSASVAVPHAAKAGTETPATEAAPGNSAAGPSRAPGDEDCLTEQALLWPAVLGCKLVPEQASVTADVQPVSGAAPVNGPPQHDAAPTVAGSGREVEEAGGIAAFKQHKCDHRPGMWPKVQARLCTPVCNTPGSAGL